MCCLCAYLFLCNAFLLSRQDDFRLWEVVTAGLLILLIIPPPLLLTANASVTPRPSERTAASSDEDRGLHPGEVPLLHEEASAPRSPQTGDVSAPPPRLRGQRSSDLTVSQCLHCVEFWLLFWSLAAGAGGALVLVNNLAQVAASMGSSAEPASLVALFSVCNAIGRLAMGVMSTLPVARPTFLVAALAIMASALWSLTAATPAVLFVAVALCGLCFGSFWSFAPLAVGELFGEKNSGTIYGAVGTSPAVGSFFLNTLMTGRVYDAHARMPPPSPEGVLPTGPLCEGPLCFRLTFQISSATALVGMLLAIVLLRRTRHMYKRVRDPV